ncbi:MAG: PBP1A family penicillin-binding protein [Candidatus Levybacteria bacterium]|nr:PBP1A family penicillin-binding protein [Candidatus Levybacteria bacterium]
MQKPTVFIFHGFGGKQADSWLSWLEKKLLADGYDVIYPDFPQPHMPELAAWDDVLLTHKDKLRGSIIVTHSLGGIFALHVIQKYKVPIKQLICVALPKNYIEGKMLAGLWQKINDAGKASLKRFIEQNFDWRTIHIYSPSTYLLYSDNDTAIPFEETVPFYQKHLPDASIQTLHDKGHFNYKNGVHELPEILTLIAQNEPKVGNRHRLFGIIKSTSMAFKTSRRMRSKGSRSSFDARKMFTLSKFMKWGFFAFLALLLVVPALFLWYSRDLPTPGTLVTSKYSDATRIYDKKGTLLYSVFEDENRTYVTLNKIPKKLQQATIAVEDENFYENNGFSPTGIIRAARDSLFERRISGGGSTITQQLVKNVLLSNEQSLPRKIKELILAIQVDQRYSKDEVLEMYLNNIPYGGTAVGVEAASEQYFGKKAKDLNLSDSAFLAGLPQSPSLYTPFNGEKRYLGRSKDVLRQMQENGYVTKNEADKAYKDLEKYSFEQKDVASIKAPHFVMYVRDVLARQFGEQMVTTGGLQVTTSLDYDIQQESEKIVKEEIGKLEKFKVSNGAAVVSDPKTGEILAMVGSSDYFDRENDGNFNVAVSETRQPGSSLKPIAYAAALEKGYTASTMLMDVRTDFPGGAGQPAYSPVNYDGAYRGPVQIRYALGNSLNIPAVKTLAMVGLGTVMQKGYDMGIENWEPTAQNKANAGLSLVLGGRETSLLDEVTAYGVFANKGVRQDPVTVLKVTDNKGKVLYEKKKTEGKKVLSEEIAFIISHILLDNSARTAAFGARSALNIAGKQVSVKTGTTDEKRDNWTIGYTPSYVVGVWVGNNDNSPMNNAIASGVTGASPIWNDIMTYVLKGKSDEQPQVPSNVVSLQVDAFAGGLPHAGQPTRSEYFVKGTEPTAESPIYKEKDGQQYVILKEEDPVSGDGENRWQKAIDAWIQTNHKDNKLYNPPDELKNGKTEESSDPTPTSEVTVIPTVAP